MSRKFVIVVVAGCLAPLAALAQSSPHYLLREQTFNSSGRPRDGVVLTSTHYQIARDSVGVTGIGEGRSCMAGLSPTEHCYQLDGGLVAAFPAPEEIRSLTIAADKVTLNWWGDRAAGTYNLYRDLLTNLPGRQYGKCDQHGISNTSTVDPDTPPKSDGFFYLVTVKDTLGEEGTKGWDSSGHERPNPYPCP